MAINRAPFNALVDDDGSNLIGSVWNKAAIKDVLLDPIDTASLAVPMNAGAGQSFNVVGTLNDWAPAGGTAKIVWLLNATGATDITGLQAEAAGTTHLLINSSGTVINLWNQHPNSAAFNRFVGPGFANYALGVWGGVWIMYQLNGWIILKA